VDVLLDTYPHLHRSLHDAYFKRSELFRLYEAGTAATHVVNSVQVVNSVGPIALDSALVSTLAPIK
jgi:hypothetical protein